MQTLSQWANIGAAHALVGCISPHVVLSTAFQDAVFRSFPVMISLLNLYGALGEKRAAEAPRRGAGWYEDPALRCYYEGRGSELWCNQHQLRQPERMAAAPRPRHPARRQQQPIFVPDSPVVSIQRKCTVLKYRYRPPTENLAVAIQARTVVYYIHVISTVQPAARCALRRIKENPRARKLYSMYPW